MRPTSLLVVALTTAVLAPAAALRRLPDPRRLERGDRGDVPGYVMIAFMTALIVLAVLTVARPALEGLFQDAIDSVGDST